MIGNIVNKYRFERLIGSGGMGTVYLAQNIETREKVAIKMLGREFNNNEQLKQRFINEARTLRLLHHQNIIVLKEFYENEDFSLLIMEYVEGRNLEEILLEYKSGVPIERLKNIFLQVLCGLNYAHSKGIAHRDIKPSNIIVTKENGIKICDFGISKAIQDCTTNLTATGSRLGTIRYMSPEHIIAKKDNPVDFQSDIYSLGVTMHQLITGLLPYDGVNNEFEIAKHILEKDLSDIHLLKPEIPLLYSQIVAKMVAKDKYKRYKTCSDIINFLNDDHTKKEIQAPQMKMKCGAEDIQETTENFAKKRRIKHLIIGLSSFVITFLIIFIIVVSVWNKDWFNKKTEKKGNNSEKKHEIMSDKKAQEPVYTVVEEMPTFPGGDEARIKFLCDNIKYPLMAKQAGIQGNVYLTFIIDEKGRVTDVKVLRGIGGGCDEEAVRVVKMSPPWNAGRIDGKPVRVQFNMPIKFTLN